MVLRSGQQPRRCLRAASVGAPPACRARHRHICSTARMFLRAAVCGGTRSCESGIAPAQKVHETAHCYMTLLGRLQGRRSNSDGTGTKYRSRSESTSYKHGLRSELATGGRFKGGSQESKETGTQGKHAAPTPVAEHTCGGVSLRLSCELHTTASAARRRCVTA